MANQRLISPVADVMDKQQTYREQMGKFKQAMQYGFYLQAVMIDYAVIEDRLRSMLYHMAFLSDRKALKVWEKTKKYLKEMVSSHQPEEKTVCLGIKTISNKITLVKCVMSWTQEETPEHGDKFLTILKRQCESMDVEAVLFALSSIEEWCKYRNELVHGLMNKKMESLNAELQQRAEVGMELARILDNEIRQLKKGNKIRHSMNLPMR